MSRKTILLVEDTRALASEIEDLLRMENYEVLTAANGVEALEILKATRVDVIITDLLMPQMDGFEILRHIRAEPSLANIRTIILTAKAEADVDITARELGVSLVLRKPCKGKVFLDSVNRII